MSNLLYALGRWAFRHPRRVLAAWMAVLVLAGVAALGLGDGTKNSFDIPGTESQEAIDGLGRTFPELSGASAFAVVVAPEGGTVTDDRTRGLLADSIEQMEQVSGVTSVVSPFDELNPVGVTDDEGAARVLVQFEGDLTSVTPDEQDDLIATGEALRSAGYTVAFGGDIFTNTGPQLSIIELIGVIVAFVVLYLMFRSLRAAVMPIVTAVLGVLVSMSLIIAATGFLTISSTAPLLALMIGLAVGIDYALFIVARHREQLAEGMEPEEAAARSVATAGSAVVFAGVTVVIALLGLAIARIPFLTVMGAVAALAVVIAVAVALTVLPALLGRAGASLTPSAEHPTGGFSRRWVLAMIRRPMLAIVVVVIGLAIATVPAKDLRLALPDNGTAPAGSSQRVAFDIVAEEFGPGFNAPLLVTLDIISTTDPVGVVSAVADDLRAMDGVAAIGLATPNPTADTGIVQVIPTTAATDERTNDLVERIRDRADGWKDEHGTDVAVTGLTAGGIDVSERLFSALLPFGLIVVGLSVLLLMIVFRSFVVPLKATLGFVLSTGASFGAVVAVFQWGWLMDLLHVEQTGPLISFLPIILMAVLFGLSMDYEVFLMARMKEEYVRTGDPRRAVVDGFVGSSRVVTAAALIMLAVFAAFVPEGDPNIQPVAFALAIGVFVDAFLIRMLFAPAVLELFGRRSWILPARVERQLPHIDVEGEGLHRRVELQAWPRPGSTAAVTAAGLTADGPDGLVFNDVSFEIWPGDRLVVHGPSGSGKTALLLTLAGRMDFDHGRLRVDGRLLPQESAAVRHVVALAEVSGINDLDDNLSVDQHIAERLSIRSFGLWVGRQRLAPVLRSMNDALAEAHRRAGVPFEPVEGSALVSSLDRLERKVLGVTLALVGEPRLVVLDDADDLRSAELIDLLWTAVDHLLDARGVTLLASVQSPSAAPAPSDRLHLVELSSVRAPHEVLL
ncbi:ABC transporter, ATP-binding protein [Aeromicrobium marinum DSM 15272]|uniref:ABC transporter, ATP-binding protein n=1 Tax=Aeromicrobium marinum DSM 15272 TaxID=585531 RepID=E2S973_9ACTN|nr:MMPL family transporter [Aeromicrobium marinum]EFQ83797.1 ABC transporter, ATP-binding protein [Aeromicrobium marinum DSM 15272]